MRWPFDFGTLLIGIAALTVSVLSAARSDSPKRSFRVSDSAQLVQAVKDMPKEGGLIMIEPGRYEISETLMIEGKSNVNIVGSGWSTVIARLGDGDAIVFKGSVWNCAVRNLTIEGDSKAKKGSGVVFRDGEWSGISVIDYCLIRNFAESGIRFEGDSKKPFSSNTVSNCWLIGNLGDQLYSKCNNDFYFTANQLGAPAERVPRSGCLLDDSSAGSYTLNYHWGNRVGLRVNNGSHYNRIENNRLEQSRESGLLIGGKDTGNPSRFAIITGNTIHTNSEHNFGKYPAVAAYGALDVTFTGNQVFSWDAGKVRHKHALLADDACQNWIIKDNIFRHSTGKALVYSQKSGHIVKDNICD